MGGPDGRARVALPGARDAGARPQPPGDGGAPGCLHPLQSLRARLPRGPGQRRHRHGVPQRRLEDRVRHGRPDGGEHLRRLRRVRAGLPDRRADAVVDRRRAGRRPSRGRPPGRQRMPVLWGRLPDHLSHQGRQDPLRHRAQRAGQREPAVRQGSLRLRLRRPPGTADETADPQGRRAQGRGRSDRSAQSLEPLSRGELGGSAGPCRQRPAGDPRCARRARSRRLRLGQGLERGGVPVPEARAHRLRLEQRRPLHAPLPRQLGRGAAREHRLGRGERAVHRGHGRGRDHRDRGEPDPEPSGRRDLLQAGSQARQDAGGDGSRAARRSPATPPTCCSSSPAPTFRC